MSMSLPTHSFDRALAKGGSLAVDDRHVTRFLEANNKTVGAEEHGLLARTGLPNAPSPSQFIIVSESIRVWVLWSGREKFSEERCPQRWTSQVPRVPSPSAPSAVATPSRFRW